MNRRVTGTIVMLVGVVFIVMVLGAHLFRASNSFERLSKDFRPLNTSASVTALRGDIAGLQAVGNEFAQKGTAVIGPIFEVTPQQAAATFAQQFPATARGVLALPTIASQLNGLTDTLANEQARFAQADAIPTTSQSSIVVPWFILITGILALLAGFAMMAPGMVAPALGLLLGAVMLISPLTTSLPQKSADADTLNDHLRPVFTTTTVTGLRTSLATLQAMGAELQTTVVPTLAQRLGVSPTEAQQFLARSFPVLSAALPQFPTAFTRLGQTIDVVDRNIVNFRNASQPTLEPIAWITVGGGIATILLSGWVIATAGLAPAEAELRRERRRMRHAA